MSKSIRFVNRSFKHFFIHDAEDSCDGSYQFKDDSPYPFGDGNFKAVQGKQLMNMEMQALSTLPVYLQIRKKVVHNRPTLGWTV